MGCVGLVGTCVSLCARMCPCVSALHCALFAEPKDIQGCSTAPEEFSPTGFPVLSLFRGMPPTIPARDSPLPLQHKDVPFGNPSR